jgi:hypothetical protein
MRARRVIKKSLMSLAKFTSSEYPDSEQTRMRR